MDIQQPGMFSYVTVEERQPKHYPIRKPRVQVEAIQIGMDALPGSRYVHPAGTTAPRRAAASGTQ